jgi:hypothetical protein
VRQEPPDVAGVLIPAQPGPQRPLADTGSGVRASFVRVRQAQPEGVT